MRLSILAVLAAVATTPAQAAEWNFAFNQGIAEYSARTASGSLSLSCAEGGVAPGSVGVQVRREGFTPAKNEPVTFTAGKLQVAMFTDADGSVSYGSVAAAPRFRALWALLRSGTSVQVRFGPGAPLSFPLAGAAKLLGPVPCPKQVAN